MRSFVLNRVPIKRRERLTIRRGRASSYTHPDTRKDEKAVAESYRGIKYEGAVAVYIDIYRAMPKDRPLYLADEPDTFKPDIDNIAKAILDGLNGVAYDDDKQVVELHVTKHNRKRKSGDSVRYRVESREHINGVD